jgi:hypothetical protein
MADLMTKPPVAAWFEIIGVTKHLGLNYIEYCPECKLDEFVIKKNRYGNKYAVL